MLKNDETLGLTASLMCFFIPQSFNRQRKSVFLAFERERLLITIMAFKANHEAACPEQRQKLRHRVTLHASADSIFFGLYIVAAIPTEIAVTQKSSQIFYRLDANAERLHAEIIG